MGEAELNLVRVEAEVMLSHLAKTGAFSDLVERYVAESGERPSSFGRAAAQNPNFLKLLRDGRVYRPEIQRRVLEYIVSGGGEA